MGKTNQAEKKTPKNCRECGHWEAIKSKVRIHEVLEHTITQLESKITAKGYKPTVAEYVKLLQLERELGSEDEPREITVTWVGPQMALDIAK